SFLGRALLHDPKSFTYGYLDEKLVDTGLTKFLGLCPSALSRYLEIASACSTSSAPFLMRNLLTPVLRSFLASALQPCLGTWRLPLHAPPPRPLLRPSALPP
ncbi:unnamed protein product, partial [Musa acuminata var. zebrina]